jgi:hypothetical protein
MNIFIISSGGIGSVEHEAKLVDVYYFVDADHMTDHVAARQVDCAEGSDSALKVVINRFEVSIEKCELIVV